MKEKLMNNKKKIIAALVTIAALAIALVGGYVGTAYYYATQNDNYSEEEIKQLALEQVDGEIMSIHKEFDMEDDRLSQSEFEYEIEIKTPQNRLQEVTIHSRTGVVEVDNDNVYHHD